MNSNASVDVEVSVEPEVIQNTPEINKNDALLQSIFEIVKERQEQKPIKKPRKKREYSEEQKAKMLANLQKGRETSLRKRQEKSKAKQTPPKKDDDSDVEEPVAEVITEKQAKQELTAKEESKLEKAKETILSVEVDEPVIPLRMSIGLMTLW